MFNSVNRFCEYFLKKYLNTNNYNTTLQNKEKNRKYKKMSCKEKIASILVIRNLF